MNNYTPESDAEREFLAQYDPSKFPVITHTVDLVVVCPHAANLYVLLVQRANYPYKDRWALPGGFIGYTEFAKESALRELREEAGLNLPDDRVEHVGLADLPDRDPRGRVISSVYSAQVLDLPEVYAGDDAKNAKWWPVSDALIEPLAFDHNVWVQKAVSKMIGRDTA